MADLSNSTKKEQTPLPKWTQKVTRTGWCVQLQRQHSYTIHCYYHNSKLERLRYHRKKPTLHSNQSCTWENEIWEHREGTESEENEIELYGGVEVSIGYFLLIRNCCTCKSLFETSKNSVPKIFLCVFFNWPTERFELLFTGIKIVKPERLNEQSVLELHYVHSSSTKLSVEGNLFWWFGVGRNIENKCNICTTGMSSGKSLKYQLLTAQ